MILIADSGASKTEWRLLGTTMPPRAFRGAGINPYFIDSEGIAEQLRLEVLPEIAAAGVEQVFFYGAGCGRMESAGIVQQGLQIIFPDAAIEVQSDLLGAARAMAQQEPSLVAILGTGSNTCFYDGKQIAKQVPSLGFILGDEGSGTDLGKALLTAYIYKELDDGLIRRFEEKFPDRLSEILNKVYKQAYPNRYIASFVPFLHEQHHHPQCIKLMERVFSGFFDRVILRYRNAMELPLHLTGGVAHNFSHQIRRIAALRNIQIGKISQHPMDGLVRFHAFS